MPDLHPKEVFTPDGAIDARGGVDDSLARLDRLAEAAEDLLRRCRARGADQAEVSCSEEHGLGVNVRTGEVETVEATRDRGIAVTVYFGQRKASASTADLRAGSLEATVEQACAIARHTEADPAAGLADAALMARAEGDGRFPEFDGWHPWALDAARAGDIALACEQAGRDDPRIRNSDGASVGSSESLSVYAYSHGFSGRERGTRHPSGVATEDLEAAAAVGRHAAARTIGRLAPRALPTATMPVLFSAEMARSLLGHLVGAISGGALYRRASFLLDSAGTRLFPDWFAIDERPFLPRGLRSAAFDAEGVATRESPLVRDGVLQRYVLGSYSARRLGLETTANAGGVHNLDVAANAGTLDDMLRGMGRGFLVTELMGQGVNAVTGDYSRGAAGFLVEGGEIVAPVDGVTVAGNLRAMFAAIEAVGSDVDPRSHIRTGPILVGAMTVAGGDG